MKKIALIILFDDQVLDLINNPQESLNYWTEVYRSSPIYPREALEKEILGCVKLSFIISENGTTEDIKVLWSEPSDIFNTAAINSLRKHYFKPTEKNKNKVKIKTDILTQFSIPDVGTYEKCET